MLCITLSDNSNLKHFIKSISKVSWAQGNREKAELRKIENISLTKRYGVDTEATWVNPENVISARSQAQKFMNYKITRVSNVR